MGDEDKDNIEIKMILLGESGVGKTSIISRYVENIFEENVTTSHAMTYVQKDLTIENQKIQLNIWDTVGQEKYRSLSKLFFKDTKIVILVYAITDMTSFKGLDYWSSLYKETIGDDAILGIVGNKSDLYLEQEVSQEKGEELAKQKGGFFSEISAKENGDQLDSYINKLVTEYLKKNPNIMKNQKKLRLEADDDMIEIKAGCCSGSKKKKMLRRYSSILQEFSGVINCVFLGEDSVGKTSIINRIKKQDFNPAEKHTNELIEYKYQYNHKQIVLEIVINDVDNDKKKSKEFINILKSSEIFFLVYDVKNKQSLENIEYWIEVISKVKDDLSKILIYILANKNDKNDANENNEMIREGKDLASEKKYLIKAISAKDNEGIMGLIDESVEYYLTIS